MDSQPEFFADLPHSNPRGRFAEVRVDEKVIPFRISRWKNGTIRGDLSAYGAGEVTSRNWGFFWEKVLRRFRERYNARIVEVVNAQIGEVFSEVAEELGHPKALGGPRPARLRKKEITPSAGVYANPFAENPDQRFGKYPDWLLAVSDKHLKPQEKLIYGRLLFPLPPICKSFRKDTGEIVGLNQGALAKAVGMSRRTANHWLISLQAGAWIECVGSPGSKQITRFFYKEYMPETCRTCRQVGVGSLPVCPAQPAGRGRNQPAGMSRATCGAYPQVSGAIEKRESRRERRESSNSPFPSRPPRSRYDGPDW